MIPFRQPGKPEELPGKWEFLDYSGFEDWYNGLSEEGRDIFDSVLKTNWNTPIPLHWNSCKKLQGSYRKAGLWEWCFFADDCQQRAIGMFGANRKQAIFLNRLYSQTKSVQTIRQPRYGAQKSPRSASGKGEAKCAKGSIGYLG